MINSWLPVTELYTRAVLHWSIFHRGSGFMGEPFNFADISRLSCKYAANHSFNFLPGLSRRTGVVNLTNKQRVHENLIGHTTFLTLQSILLFLYLFDKSIVYRPHSHLPKWLRNNVLCQCPPTTYAMIILSCIFPKRQSIMDEITSVHKRDDLEMLDSRWSHTLVKRE